MKKIIFCSLVIALFGCANQGNETKWVKQTNTEQDKQKAALNECKALASEQAGEAPISQQIPKCSRKYNPSCSFTQEKVAGQNEKTQEDWQQVFDTVIQSCMDEKGYEKSSL